MELRKVVVDDIFLHYKLTGLKSALVGDDKSLWGPILEKAFAKVKGNYAASDLGLLKKFILTYYLLKINVNSITFRKTICLVGSHNNDPLVSALRHS